MVSPEGWLFDKEALLKYIIEKKQEYARKMKEYERQKDRDLKVSNFKHTIKRYSAPVIFKAGV